MAASSATRHGSGGKGVGWGGPAKGGGSKAPSFSDSLENQIGGGVPRSPEVRQSKAARDALRLEQAEAVKNEMFRIATEGEREADRVNAGSAFLDRVEGKPVQRNVNWHGDLSELSDDELRAELDRLAGDVDPPGGDCAGDAQEAGAA